MVPMKEKELSHRLVINSKLTICAVSFTFAGVDVYRSCKSAE